MLKDFIYETHFNNITGELKGAGLTCLPTGVFYVKLTNGYKIFLYLLVVLCL